MSVKIDKSAVNKMSRGGTIHRNINVSNLKPNIENQISIVDPITDCTYVAYWLCDMHRICIDTWNWSLFINRYS